MFKKLSLQYRLTITTALLITCICISLTVVLNFSANRLANRIEATVAIPAKSIDDEYNVENGSDIPALSFAPSDDAQLAKQSFMLESILFTIIAVLVGSGITYYVVGRALDPVRRLNKQVKNINAFNLSETIEVSETKDELAELTESFNEMTDKLHEAFLMQQRFSASAAHELRTPLTILQTKMDVFSKKENHTQEEYETLVTDVKKQTTRLRNLIRDLLDMTVIDSVPGDEFSLSDLLEDIIDELSILASEKGIHLSLECADNIVIVGQIDLLHSAFYNLLENGIKYNVPNGSVDISACTNEGRKVAVFIKDTGIGIPDNMKKQVFEPFFRVDKSRSREMGGAGLGLSLVDTIIRKHGGCIVISDNSGGGSCFKIVL